MILTHKWNLSQLGTGTQLFAKRSNVIFMIYDHENIVVDDIDKNNDSKNIVGSSSRSHD